MSEFIDTLWRAFVRHNKHVAAHPTRPSITRASERAALIRITRLLVLIQLREENVRSCDGSTVDLISWPKKGNFAKKRSECSIRASIPSRRKYKKKKYLTLLSASLSASLLRNVFFTLLGAEGSTYFRPRRNSDRWFFILAFRVAGARKMSIHHVPDATFWVDYF